MSNEVRVTDPKTGGQKGSKLERYDLIAPEFLVALVLPFDAPLAAKETVQCLASFLVNRHPAELLSAQVQLSVLLEREDVHPGDELARVYGFGAKKYASWNWLKGYAWSLTFAACCRHISLWARGQIHDEETVLHHLAHAMWHVITLHTFYTRALGTDDLYRDPDPIVPASDYDPRYDKNSGAV